MVEKICHLKLKRNVYLKYTKIWNKFKKLQGTKFHSQPIYDNKYIKTKVKTFSSMINTFFLGSKIPYIGAIYIHFVLKVDKKNYPQVYLEQCKYKIKRIKPIYFNNAKADLSSDDSDDLDD